jgi:hypothetical protein
MLTPGTALAAGPAPVMHRLASKPGQLRAAVRFWTPARIRHAPMRGPLRLAGSTSSLEVAPAGGVARGRPHRVPPLTRSGAQASSDEVADPTALPQRTVGLLLGKDRRGIFGCSATVVNSTNASVVLTAGHCVKDRYFTQKAIFVPGYHDGETPFGIFPAKSEGAPKGWLRRHNLDFDFGAFVLGRNGAGQRVGDAVGGVGLATGQPTTGQLFDAYGYPAAAPFDPNRQYHCQSPYLGADPHPLALSGPPTMEIGCDMTQGASGGGWLVGEGQYVNGLSSYGYRGQPGYIYGPYFGRAIWKLYSKAQRAG